jgi:hypothetical protein
MNTNPCKILGLASSLFFTLFALCGCQTQPVEDRPYAFSQLHEQRKSESSRLPSSENLTSSTFLPAENCNPLAETAYVIGMLERIRTQDKLWPDFDVSHLRVILTDDQFENRSLLAFFERDAVSKLGVQVTPCQDSADLFWIKDRPVPKGQSDQLIQCATSSLSEQESHLRCDFFPEMQSLFEDSQRQVRFYHVPDVEFEDNLRDFVAKSNMKSELDARAVRAANIVHDYVHEYQEQMGFAENAVSFNGPNKNHYFDLCLGRTSMRQRIDNEKSDWEDLITHYSEFSLQDKRDWARKIIGRRLLDNEAKDCWDDLRALERWEGIPEFIAFSALTQAVPDEQPLRQKMALVLIGSDIHYYATGHYWARLLADLGGDESWKNSVNEGQYLDAVLAKKLGIQNETK